MADGLQQKYITGLFFLLTLCVAATGGLRAADLSEIKNLVQAFKKDERGPYQAIRWFCPDGTVLLPSQRCPQPGGIQHALHKDVVQRIAKENGVYLGQILAGTPFPDFFDDANRNSRVKHYQIEKFLQAADDGWIFRRARYYRGAIQAEDEESWGIGFLSWVLARNDAINSQFFFLRQAIKDIPHRADDNRWQSIRANSKTISDSLPSFVDLRVKLHGQPEFTDVQQVRKFYARNKGAFSSTIDVLIQNLIQDLESAYQPADISSLRKYIKNLPNGSGVSKAVDRFVRLYGSKQASVEHNQNLQPRKFTEIADLLWDIRTALPSIAQGRQRLEILDLSNELENMLFRDISMWQTSTMGGLLEKNYALAKAAAGSGFLEIWEWNSIEPILRPFGNNEMISQARLIEYGAYARKIVEWSTGMFQAAYDPDVALFAGFEPLARGFIDDRVRSSLLLPLGEIASELADAATGFAGSSNKVMSISNQTRIRGLNPGFALGDLEVIMSSPDDARFAPEKIYAVTRAPADLKPVAGIATVAEGNLVSHVQLLARNLGIPNAVISTENLRDLFPYSGTTVFYAVSPRGTVVMKSSVNMSPEERALVEVRKRQEERIRVDTRKINLDNVELPALSVLRASDSGRLCGPKAANLGELKWLFPDKVVNGLVIPFGVFRQHLDQHMPGKSNSYWQDLQEIFSQASTERLHGKSEEEIENFVLHRLTILRDAIKNISLLPGFHSILRQRFKEIFGVECGKIPVFVRSDTNMEDLKDFTGAGLNLTVFNVVDESKVLQAIRDVWSSPYTERSYRWRQKYLLNPEDVYPSILILPTVNVEKSGVMITTGVSTPDHEDVTIAFNRGAGGAVEGQSAESYLLKNSGNHLLISPSREATFTTLPVTGGTAKRYAQLNEPILSDAEIGKLRLLADEIKRKMPFPGPFDVELGFKGSDLWLFQVRPYVENKRAKFSEYLQSLDPQLSNTATIAYDQELEPQQK